MAAKPTTTAPAADEIVNPADASPDLSATAASAPAADAPAADSETSEPKASKGRTRSPWKGVIPEGIEPERTSIRRASGVRDVITFPVYAAEQDRTVIVEIPTEQAEIFLAAFDAVLDDNK